MFGADIVFEKALGGLSDYEARAGQSGPPDRWSIFGENRFAVMMYVRKEIFGRDGMIKVQILERCIGLHDIT